MKQRKQRSSVYDTPYRPLTSDNNTNKKNKVYVPIVQSEATRSISYENIDTRNIRDIKSTKINEASEINELRRANS